MVLGQSYGPDLTHGLYFPWQIQHTWYLIKSFWDLARRGPASSFGAWLLPRVLLAWGFSTVALAQVLGMGVRAAVPEPQQHQEKKPDIVDIVDIWLQLWEQAWCWWAPAPQVSPRKVPHCSQIQGKNLQAGWPGSEGQIQPVGHVFDASVLRDEKIQKGPPILKPCFVRFCKLWICLDPSTILLKYPKWPALCLWIRLP